MEAAADRALTHGAPADPTAVHRVATGAAFLLADAWFDVTTSGGNLAASVVSAALVELPLAAYLVRHATRVTVEATRAATPAA